MFEKSLTDLVKGIRAHKRSPSAFISASILECKNELRDLNEFVKANAIKKLTFLRMMGYEFSWANFATIEVMSSQRFGHKRVGYLAAAQSFNEETDVILLTTNLLKKEFKSSNIYEVGLAINCLSNIVTPDLARELLPDLTRLTQHSHGYIRKKAVLCLFKLFMKYPQGLRLTFDRVKQCLDDSEPAVVSCAVNVITELADKNPKNYLLMAPHFFNLLTSSSNNWMLIKVVKLLGSLVSEEPRLARKLLEPLAAIVQNTQAKSLLYEAVYTLTLALPYARKADGSVPKTVPAIVQLCMEKLKAFVEETDQNLKYLGLVGFVSLMKSHPKEVVEQRGLILRCLCDDDVTIRSRALELLTGMVTKKNLQELVDQLMQHVRLSEGAYRDELIGKIVFMCSREKYSYIADFKWYISILVAMSRLHGTEHGMVISGQITDVATRVFPVREFCVGRMVEILLASDLTMGRSKETIWEVLRAAAWVVGEYSSFVTSASPPEADGVHCGLLRVLLSTRSLDLPPRTQAVYLQSALKVFAAASGSSAVDADALLECVGIFEANLPAWMQSKEIEVQERASTCHKFLCSLKLLQPNIDQPPPAVDEDSESKSATPFTGEPDAPITSDFLGLVMDPAVATPVISSMTTTTSTAPTCSSFQAENFKSSAPTLTRVCVPDPMKPVSAKAQKKLTAPSSSNLDTPLNAKLFNNLLQDDAATHLKRKLTIEEVYFGFFGASAKINPRRGRDEIASSNSVDLDEAATNPSRVSELVDSAPTHPGGLDRIDGTPFYLTGGDAGDGSDGEEEGAGGDFGEIKLGLSDSDEIEEVVNKADPSGKSKKGKGKAKSKSKKRKKKERATDDSLSMRADAMAIFGGDMVFRSDDDDEDSSDDGAQRVDGGSNAASGDKTFDSLAKVDLTTPLAPDEVMPERKHREVPDYTGGDAGSEGDKKKRKKEKKKKKKKGSVEAEAVAVTTNDLLDFGACGSSANAGSGSELFDALSSGDLLLPLEQSQVPPGGGAGAGGRSQLVPQVPQVPPRGASELDPDNTATLDSIMAEFAAGQWAEHSTKVKAAESNVALDNKQVVAKISALLNASIVDGSLAADGSHATLAAKSGPTGKVRIMIKMKGTMAKITIKATNKKLGKAVNKVCKGMTI
ncbi:hypothetical protein TrLO_g8250 [Triparma laevis f. longispina]|uniref:AP-3 complex subunit delta n=1 Tax=Triparma laevis f. longispina TaxID=1714387 RepID=A0A9W7FAN7_9STRA|nr:hypothetical protein TrLO_g8250 [Triparma laevis f. longispina]